MWALLGKQRTKHIYCRSLNIHFQVLQRGASEVCEYLKIIKLLEVPEGCSDMNILKFQYCAFSDRAHLGVE